MPTVQAEPYEFEFDPKTTALLVIDMQRDFVDPGGFGEALGNDVSLLRAAVPPTERVLATARRLGMFVIHTREGHRPDLSDLPVSKKKRGRLDNGIGDPGPMGRILVRGEYGHDLVDSLQPQAGEPVVELPPAVSAAELMRMLQTLPEGARVIFNLYAVEGFERQAGGGEQADREFAVAVEDRGVA